LSITGKSWNLCSLLWYSTYPSFKEISYLVESPLVYLGRRKSPSISKQENVGMDDCWITGSLFFSPGACTLFNKVTRSVRFSEIAGVWSSIVLSSSLTRLILMTNLAVILSAWTLWPLVHFRHLVLYPFARNITLKNWYFCLGFCNTQLQLKHSFLSREWMRERFQMDG